MAKVAEVLVQTLIEAGVKRTYQRLVKESLCQTEDQMLTPATRQRAKAQSRQVKLISAFRGIPFPVNGSVSR
jgi:hypothetical protein